MSAFLQRFILVALIFALTAPCLATAGDAPSNDIRNAAKVGMKTFLRPERLDYLHEHGFESQDDIDNAELGEGFEIYTIQPDKLLDESTPQDLQSLVTSTNHWSFLIRVGGKAKTVVTVGLVDGKWTPVEYGSSGFAETMSAFLATWPASSGYEYRYIRVYQVPTSLIELSNGGKFVGIIPSSSLLELATKRPIKEYDPKIMINMKDALAALRPAVKWNIERWKRPTERKSQ